MSIASKLKDLAISMGAEVTTDDDSIEEILAKMKGHTGGSYCLKIRSRTESTTIETGGTATEGTVTPGTGPAVDPSAIAGSLNTIIYEIDESYSEIVSMLKNGTYVYGIVDAQYLPEGFNGEIKSICLVVGFSQVPIPPSGITGFTVVLDGNNTIELYALNPDDPMTSAPPDTGDGGSASDTDEGSATESYTPPANP